MANVDYLKANDYCTGSGKCEVDDAGDWSYAAVDDADYRPTERPRREPPPTAH